SASLRCHPEIWVEVRNWSRSRGCAAAIASITGTSLTGCCGSQAPFASYHCREHLFPTCQFRKVRLYLEILQLAAKEGESRIDDALRLLLQRHSEPVGDCQQRSV